MTTREDVLTAIDETTAKELVDGLRIAIIAFRLKANRVAGRDRQWMRDRATRMAVALLEVTTGGIPL